MVLYQPLKLFNIKNSEILELIIVKNCKKSAKFFGVFFCKKIIIQLFLAMFTLINVKKPHPQPLSR